MEEISELELSMKHSDYIPNTAQKRLAEELTRRVHGSEGLDKALKVTQGAGPGSLGSLTEEVIEQIALDMPNIELTREEIVQKKFTEVAVLSGLLSSKGEGVRLIQNQGAYLNQEKVTDPAYLIQDQDLIGGRFLLLGSGKKKQVLVRIR
jgi:tyrosyl-tRNA synthetase